MAVDMFLKLDGIEGESKDSKHSKEIDVLSWGWGASNSGSGHYGGGSGTGKVSVQDLHFTKRVDKSTPKLMLFCCSGKHIKEGTLVVRKAGDKPVEYIKLKLENILVSSLASSGSPHDEVIHETVTLNFNKFTLDYVGQKPDGSPEPPVTTGWDIEKNEKI